MGLTGPGYPLKSLFSFKSIYKRRSLSRPGPLGSGARRCPSSIPLSGRSLSEGPHQAPERFRRKGDVIARSPSCPHPLPLRIPPSPPVGAWGAGSTPPSEPGSRVQSFDPAIRPSPGIASQGLVRSRGDPKSNQYINIFEIIFSIAR